MNKSFFPNDVVDEWRPKSLVCNWGGDSGESDGGNISGDTGGWADSGAGFSDFGASWGDTGTSGSWGDTAGWTDSGANFSDTSGGGADSWGGGGGGVSYGDAGVGSGGFGTGSFGGLGGGGYYGGGSDSNFTGDMGGGGGWGTSAFSDYGGAGGGGDVFSTGTGGVNFTDGSQQFGNFFGGDGSNFYPADSGGWNNFVSPSDTYFGGQGSYFGAAPDFNSTFNAVSAPTGMDLAGDFANPGNSLAYGGGWGPDNAYEGRGADYASGQANPSDAVLAAVPAAALMSPLAAPAILSGAAHLAGMEQLSRSQDLPEVNVTATRPMDVEVVSPSQVPASVMAANPAANPNAPALTPDAHSQTNPLSPEAEAPNPAQTAPPASQVNQAAPPSMPGQLAPPATPPSAMPPAPPPSETKEAASPGERFAADLAKGLDVDKGSAAGTPERGPAGPLEGAAPSAPPASNTPSGFLASVGRALNPISPARAADNPVGVMTPAAVQQARDFLVQTATPGRTMTQQGVEQAISRLAPEFAARLASAIQEARAAGIPASVFSAFRSPSMGANPGFAFRSQHARGVAIDMAGIGRPGSETSKAWYQIATKHGLYNPYGPSHGAEWNHYQAVPEKEAPGRNPFLPPPNMLQTWAGSGMGRAGTRGGIGSDIATTPDEGARAETMMAGQPPNLSPERTAGRGPGASRDSRTAQAEAVRGQNLIAERGPPIAELRGNPQLMDTFARIVWSEIGSKGNDKATLAQIETMLNAARANQISVADVVAGKHGPGGGKSGYFPGTPGRENTKEARSAAQNRANMPPEFAGKVAQFLEAAARGSDVAKGATGNASGSKGAGTITARIGGEKFGIEGYQQHQAWNRSLNNAPTPPAVAALPPLDPEAALPARSDIPFALPPAEFLTPGMTSFAGQEAAPSQYQGSEGTQAEYGQNYGPGPGAVTGPYQTAESDYGANYGRGPEAVGALAPGWAGLSMLGARSGEFPASPSLAPIGYPVTAVERGMLPDIPPPLQGYPVAAVERGALPDIPSALQGYPVASVERGTLPDIPETLQGYPVAAVERGPLADVTAAPSWLANQQQAGVRGPQEFPAGPTFFGPEGVEADYGVNYGPGVHVAGPPLSLAPEFTGAPSWDEAAFTGKSDLTATPFDARFGDLPGEYAGPFAGPDVVGGREAPIAPDRGIGADIMAARGVDPGLAPSLNAIAKSTQDTLGPLSGVVSNMPAAQRGQMMDAIRGMPEKDRAEILSRGVPALLDVISRQSGYPRAQVENFLNNQYQSFGYPGYPGGLGQLGRDLAAAQQQAIANAVPGRASPQFQDPSIVANVQDLGFPGVPSTVPSQLAAAPQVDPEAAVPAAQPAQSLPQVTVEAPSVPGGAAPPVSTETPQQAPSQVAQEVLSNPQAAPIVSNIAATYGVDIGTAALIYRLFVMADNPEEFPIRAMADGGRPMANETVLVGEQGPELFVPDVPGTVYPYVPPIGKGNNSWPRIVTRPGFYQGYGREIQRQNSERQDMAPLLMQLIDAGALKLNEKEWGRFLQEQAPSKNIEDRRRYVR